MFATVNVPKRYAPETMYEKEGRELADAFIDDIICNDYCDDMCPCSNDLDGCERVVGERGCMMCEPIRLARETLAEAFGYALEYLHEGMGEPEPDEFEPDDF